MPHEPGPTNLRPKGSQLANACEDTGGAGWAAVGRGETSEHGLGAGRGHAFEEGVTLFDRRGNRVPAHARDVAARVVGRAVVACAEEGGLDASRCLVVV